MGSEQGGIRPVLIVQNNVGNRYSPTVIAAAITSQTGKNKLPTHIEVQSQLSADGTGNGLAKRSIILLEQIRTIDKRRLREHMGRLTQEQMAIRVGKKRASVTNYLRLLKLPAKLQHDLKVGLLSVGHAKVLLGVEDLRMQEYLCDLVIKEDLSVRQLEDKIKKLTDKKPAEIPETQDLPEDYFKVLEIVGKYFENNISLKRTKNGKGSMTIHFSSDEEVQKFLKALEDSKF